MAGMSKCLDGCTCGRHRTHSGKAKWQCPEGCTCGKHAKAGNVCPPGCTCKRHSCLPGCTCSRHQAPSQTFTSGRTCEPGCECGRHVGPWAGKERPANKENPPALRHGHTWQDPVTGEARVSPTYKSWQAMKYRCQKRPDYIALGIQVCDRWANSFDNFLADMGERPEGMTLDRWPNNRGDYRPGNCRWATPTEQANNRRPYAEWKK